MKHLILGTAGHIDHGKTSLVMALTGIDTDRLPEEKARGITIELGFAQLDLPDGIRLGIVDVPGHERFVRTMVAGVGGMDLVMLVIAADKGVMPQTREHLEICQLLGLKNGLVALTKSDLLDNELQELAIEEVRDYLCGSFLEHAKIVPVSAKSGAGLDNLKNELHRLALEVNQKRIDGPFRLPVDRVFTVPGFGTVVTGTLLSGQIKVGDSVEILPTSQQSRVRVIQAHGISSESGVAGQRLALNLNSIEHTTVSRGTVMVPPGRYHTTRSVDVLIHLLTTASQPIRNRAILRLHSSTYEVSAQIILFDRAALHPGESGYANLRLPRPVLLLPGDTYILRCFSPPATMGGGKVLDSSPSVRRRHSADTINLLKILDNGDDSQKIAGLVSSTLLSGASQEEIIDRTGLSVKRFDAAAAPLLSAGQIVLALRDPRTYLSITAFSSLRELLLEEVRKYCAENPIKQGIGKEELKTRMPQRSNHRFFAPCLACLEKEGKIVSDRELVKLPPGDSSTNPGHGDVQLRTEQALLRGGIEPPSLKELSLIVGIAEKDLLGHLNLMVRDGRAVKIHNDLYYAPASLHFLEDKLLDYLSDKQEITPPEFRDLTGLSRKFMIPILEYFDAQKLTIRVGDRRLLRRKRI